VGGGLRREMRSDTGANVLRRHELAHGERYVDAFLIDSRRSGMRSKIIASFSPALHAPFPPTARSADLLEWFERSRILPRMKYARRHGPTCGFLTLVDFYPRGASDARVLAVVVCPSVCVSVTRRYCIKAAKSRITQTTPRDSPGTLDF